MSTPDPVRPRVVIVGGGAGGLELATRLGRTLGKARQADIILIDQYRVHLWKPLLHEVVSGSFDTGAEALSYRAHAASHDYEFHLGALSGLDKAARRITLAPLVDRHGEEVLPQRQLAYDHLVVAVGARTNDLGVEGVDEHCFMLDDAEDAEDFHLSLLNRFLRHSEVEREDERVRIAIVGGGATGVELAAELFNAVDRLEQLGMPRVHRDSLSVTLIEAEDRILSAMPKWLAVKAEGVLKALGVHVRTGTVVKQVSEHELTLADGAQSSAMAVDICVWTAGVRAPAFLGELGLPTNRKHQLKVTSCLNVVGEDRIHALGDCAFLQPDESGKGVSEPVPPTAQAAHQMAQTLADNLSARLSGRPAQPFVYRHHGALVSLSRFQTVGSLLDRMFKRTWLIEGRLAFWAYASLYRRHQLTVFGFWKTLGLTLTHLLERRLKARLKLY